MIIKSPDSGKIYIYDSAKTTYRNCGTQFGEPSPDLHRRSSTRANLNTPVKDNRKRKSLNVSEFPHLNVNGLPSSKRKKTSRNPPKSSQKQPNSKASKPQTLVKDMPSNKGKTAALSKSPRKPIRASKKKLYKCDKCGIDFGSKQDKAMRREKGRKADWVGCDSKTPCDFWGHACCVGLVIHPKKKIEDHSFFCPQHRLK